jgi:hypothetical protein
MSTSHERFTDEQLAPIAEAVGLPLAEFRNRAAAAESGIVSKELDFDLQVADASETNCKDINFDIKIIRVKGKVCFTPGKNWRLTIDLQVSALGVELDTVRYTFSPSQTSVCYKYNLLFAKIKLCFGVRSNRICLFTSGSVSSFGKKKSWDENILCFA